MPSVTKTLKKISRITKALLARTLFISYSIVAVWRVTEALNENLYWLLVLTLIPLIVETLYTAIKRSGKAQKWVTPNVLFFLFCAVPSIWQLELKLLSDRLKNDTNVESTSSSQEQSISVAPDETGYFANFYAKLNFSDETWALALEQVVIFILVLAKWIAPKGNLSVDQLSQLLLVHIAAGADIIELMEVFGDERVSRNEELLYVIMTVWTWSLLQFTFVLTATKQIPEIDNNDDVIVADANNRSAVAYEIEGKASHSTNKSSSSTALETRNGNSQALDQNSENTEKEDPLTEGSSNHLRQKKSVMFKTDKISVSDEPSLKGNKTAVSDDVNSTSSSNQYNKKERVATTGNKNLSSTSSETTIIGRDTEICSPTNFERTNFPFDHRRAEKDMESCCQKTNCCDCFCFYNEIWGMLLSILFQDGPFLVLRIAILFYYNIITHVNIFFAFKNIFVIFLLFNRIRVVIKEDRGNWKQEMQQVADRKRRDKELTRINGGKEAKHFSKGWSKNPASKLSSLSRSTRRHWRSWRA